MAELSLKDRNRFVAAVHERGEIRARLKFGGAQYLDRVAAQLVTHGKNTLPETHDMFWVKLYAVLDELGADYEYLGELIGPQPKSETARQTIAVRDAIRALHGALDDDERIWAQYRRDSVCHLVPESYEVSAQKGKAALKEQRHFALLGRTLHVDEFDQRARALLRQYNVDEPAMAVAFALKVAPLVSQLVAAMAPLYVA